MTLVELVMAIVLLSVVILTGVSIEMGMRRIFSSADAEAQLLGEAGPIMSLLSRDITRAIGDEAFPAYNVSSNATSRVIFVRIDSGTPGTPDAGDRIEAFNWTNASGRPRFYYAANYTSGDAEYLSGRVVSFTAALNATTGLLDVSISLRNNTVLAASPTNPEAVIRTRYRSRAATW